MSTAELPARRYPGTPHVVLPAGATLAGAVAVGAAVAHGRLPALGGTALALAALILLRPAVAGYLRMCRESRARRAAVVDHTGSAPTGPKTPRRVGKIVRDVTERKAHDRRATPHRVLLIPLFPLFVIVGLALDTCAAGCSATSAPPRSTIVSITFDDGSASQYATSAMLGSHGMVGSVPIRQSISRPRASCVSC